MTIDKLEAFIFDLDGTIYLGEKVIPGAVNVLKWVRETGAKVRFVTNNPRFSRKFYANKLNRMGISAEIGEILTSASLTADYLSNNPQYGKVFMIGEDQLYNELTTAGIPLVKQEQPDTVLVSFDTTLTYEKLLFAFKSLNQGARFIATNPDAVCPTPDGGLVDAGAIIAALEASTDRKVEKVIGKPSKLLGKLLVEELNIPASKSVVVGDRLNTDIRLAKRAGMNAVWIRANNEEISKDIEYEPDYIIESIARLPSIMSKQFA